MEELIGDLEGGKDIAAARAHGSSCLDENC
jgi:hypothetical protein